MVEAGGNTEKWKECGKKTFASNGNEKLTSDTGLISKDSLLLLSLLSVLVLMRP